MGFRNSVPESKRGVGPASVVSGFRDSGDRAWLVVPHVTLCRLIQLSCRSERSKELEILVLRHELAILHRRRSERGSGPSIGRSSLCSRRGAAEHIGELSVRPATLLRWHGELVRRQQPQGGGGGARTRRHTLVRRRPGDERDGFGRCDRARFVRVLPRRVGVDDGADDASRANVLRTSAVPRPSTSGYELSLDSSACGAFVATRPQP
jgi:hypothetical protein